MASSGITFQSNVTQFYFGNTTGGVQREFDYGGHGDYLMNMDLGKLGVHEGLTLKVRAEHRFGESIADEVGTLLAPDLAARLPLPGEDELYITNFMLTQALSDNFVIFAGKFDTLDGDYNAFASGRGIRQFSNTAFIANPIAFRTVPYSTVGVGFSYLFEGQPLFSFSVVNPVDVSNTIGLSELYAEGVTMSGELIIPTKVGGLPGQQLFAATYSNRVYTSLGQDPRVVLPNVPVATQSGSWSFYWNTHQYLAVDPCDPDRGWGYFARASIGDKETNPLEYFLSAGIGGSSAIRARANDTFGIGYYYAGTSSKVGPVLETVLGPIGDGQGFEAFYNIAVSPMVTITPDVQVIEAARENLDTALVAGVRMNLAF